MLETNNLRVAEAAPLLSPRQMKALLPVTERAAASVTRARAEIEAILRGDDARLLVVVGPCSIHDPRAALEYADRLLPLRERFADHLLICMRTYFEKPRTALGWKGLINDPHLDGTYDLKTGLSTARTLLLRLSELGLPTATEMLDPVVPQYIADLVAWSAIGARTTESQTHREMASGLSMPVGFKNGTDGSLAVAINAMRAAREPHSFLGIDADGKVAVIRTLGNPAGHLVLRGGSAGPNYHAEAVLDASRQLQAGGLCPRVLIDCSHANSGKDPQNQPRVLQDIAEQVRDGSRAVLGVMLESHLVAGRQDLNQDPRQLCYGQSITDACIDFEQTALALTGLAEAAAAAKRAPTKAAE